MNKLIKLVLGAAMIAGAATLAAPPASARVSVGVGFGVGYPGYYPGYYYGPPRYRYGRYCDPYSPYYDPYYCGDPYYRSSYYGGYYGSPFIGDVVFFDGGWWRGPFRHRHWRGNDWYWVNNGWHRNEWRGRFPSRVTFRNGGGYHNGRYNGFHGAEHFGRSRGDFRSGSSGRQFNGNTTFRGGSTSGRASFHGNGSRHESHSGGGHHGH